MGAALRKTIATAALALFASAACTPASTPVMSFDAYEHVEHATPYVISISGSGGALFYFGAAHTYDPDDRELTRIEREWRAFHPTYALNEGGYPPPERDRARAVHEAGEAGFLRFMAVRDGVPSVNLELSADDEARGLLASFSVEEVKTFYVLRQLEQHRRKRAPEPLEQMLPVWLRAFSRPRGLEGPPNTPSELDRSCRELLPEHADWRQITKEYVDPAPSGRPLLTQRISRRSNELRDAYMVRLLADFVRNGERVFAVVGASHVVMQEQALRAAIAGKPFE